MQTPTPCKPAQTHPQGVISVYDLQTLKRRKVLQAAEVGSQEYVSLGFSADGKQLLAQVGASSITCFGWLAGWLAG